MTTIGPNTQSHPEWAFETLQLHAGNSGDPQTGAVNVPIQASNAFHFPSAQVAVDRFALRELGPIYTRLGNPTNDALEARLAALEGGVGALVTASGQAATALTLLTLARQGSNIVSSASIYGGTHNLFAHTLPRYGVEVRFIKDINNPARWLEAADENTVAFFGEVIPNPRGDIFDIEAIAEVAHQVGVPLVADNTVSTPYLCQPLAHGADIVVESATKYLGGHSTALLGAIIDGGTFDYSTQPQRFPGFNQPDESYHGLVYARDLGVGSPFGANLSFILKARVEGQRDFGFAASPFNVFLVGLGVDTLSLRLERHVANAQRVAEYISEAATRSAGSGKGVAQVRYAGLPDSPYYQLAKKYTPRGPSALLNFDLAGGLEAGKIFVDALELHSHVANIGDVRSLVVHPASTTHSQLSPSELAAQDIAPGTVRLSVGLEAIDDILADLQRGLDAVAKAGY